ncbi:MAG: ABC transporter ATP-binding protein [Methanomassiliicoccales archaeon]|nr:ABC transporter ATP-binding protein [Methanomassiliicoccales archaeon]
MASEDILVRVEHLSKRYRNILALNDVSFEIRKGEIFGYIGPNGAGKTTTIKAMAGILSGFDGDVTIEGRSIRGDKIELNRNLGYLPQKAAFQDWRTVDQALRTFGLLSRIPKEALEGRIEETLTELGILETRYRKITQLSGGTVQKVGMAQAILHRPKLLVLDEPVAGLDPESRYAFKQLFQKLSHEGTTIFFSSHILSDVEDIADRIGILSAGKLVHVGNMDELRSQVVNAKELVIELSNDNEGKRTLEKVSGVQNVQLEVPGRYRIRLNQEADPDEMTQIVIEALLASGCRIRSIRPLLPTLEQIYVNYLEKGVIV